MGCGASKADEPKAPESAKAAAPAAAPQEKKAEDTKAVAYAAPVETPKPADKPAEAAQADVPKAESKPVAAEAPKAASATPDPELAFELKREIPVKAPKEATWARVKDWNLDYLKEFDHTVDIKTRETDGVKYRTVKMTTGKFEEQLMLLDEATMTVSYMMLQSFLPYAQHKVTASVTAVDEHNCMVKWESQITALNDAPTARKIAEEGLNGAIAVFKKGLEKAEP